MKITINQMKTRELNKDISSEVNFRLTNEFVDQIDVLHLIESMLLPLIKNDLSQSNSEQKSNSKKYCNKSNLNIQKNNKLKLYENITTRNNQDAGSDI